MPSRSRFSFALSGLPWSRTANIRWASIPLFQRKVGASSGLRSGLPLHIAMRGFDLNLRALPLNSACTSSLSSQVKEFERAAIKQCLLETGGNIGAALERLKIPRRTLSEKMARLGIDRRRFRPPRRESRK